MRVVFAGGGTGGHIFPIISVYEELQALCEARNISLEVLFIGHIDDRGKTTLENAGIPYTHVHAGKWRRYPSIQNVLDIFRGFWGLMKAQWYVWKFMPDVTFGKGGYASVPATFVSGVYQIPVIIHESDAKPGLANRILGVVATEIGVAFPGAKERLPEEKTAVVGGLTRPEIAEGSQNEAAEFFNLTFEKPIILIIGGSQGAEIINRTIWQMLSELLDTAEVIHVVGEAYEEEARSVKRSLGTYESRLYHYAGFLRNELKHAYKAADLVITRSGASSLADVSRNGKPSVLVPIAIDGGQQRENAYDFAEAGAAVVIEEPNFEPHLLLSKIRELFNDPDLMKQMRQESVQFATPETASRIAENLLTWGL